MFQQRRNRGQNLGLYLLAYNLLTNGYIPPITLGTILFQIAVFIGLFPAMDLRKIRDVCLLPSAIISRGEWYRVILPIFMHADDMHLYLNMISLLWKGRRLEPRLGSRRFLLILTVFTIATGLLTVALSFISDHIFEGFGFMQQCGVGFSGVIFALKVLHNSYFPDSDYYLFGWLPLPSRYSCWIELLLIEFLVPNASFIGHLAGILVGLAYIKGPLKDLIRFIDSFISVFSGFGHRLGNFHEQNHYHERNDYESQPSGGMRSGFSTYQRTPPSFSTYQRTPPSEDSYRPPSYGWNAAPSNYDEYTLGLSEEEQISIAMRESLGQHRPNMYPSAPPYPN